MTTQEMNGMTKARLINELENALFCSECYKKEIDELKRKIRLFVRREASYRQNLDTAEAMVSSVTDKWTDYPR